MKILNVYKADNGDIFVRHNGSELKNASKEMFESNLKRMLDDFGLDNAIECKAEEIEHGIGHIKYYTQEGEFIATSGIHITDEFKVFSDFVFLKRISVKSKLEMMYKRVLKDCGVEL